MRVSLTLTIEACVCALCVLCACRAIDTIECVCLVHSRRISRRWGGRVYVVCSSSVIELLCVMYSGSLCVQCVWGGLGHVVFGASCGP